MLQTPYLFLAFGLTLTAAGIGQRPGVPGPNTPDRELVKEFDRDGNGRLNREERKAARQALQESSAQEGERRGPRRGPRGRQRAPGQPGPEVQVDEVPHYDQAGVYDLGTLRTYFLEFEHEDWEEELAEFKSTDVLVPAKLTVDGKVFEEVGVSFRGASSFFMIPAGLKRSLNLSLDFADPDQRLHGVKTLNLLNLNGDESMLSTVLYSNLARRHLAAPKANFAKVVIQGRSWGIYCNVEQFNKDFVRREFGSDQGARWKVSGSPRGDGGLRYLGEEIEPYRERFEIKSKDRDADWQALVELCRVLGESPIDELDTALAPLLDLDSTLWFLAIDVVSSNSDGYWTRASDFSIYRDPNGVFHLVPHDMNEAFQEGHGGPGGPGGRPPRGGPRGDFPPGGPPPEFSEDSDENPRRIRSDFPAESAQRGAPGRRGQGGRRRGGMGPQGGVKLDPLVGLEDESKPLRSRLLANARLRERYLQYVRILARDDLSWQHVGPLVAQTRAMLKGEVAADTRKLGTLDGFLKATAPASTTAGEPSGDLYQFLSERRAFLLAHEALQDLPAEDPAPLPKPQRAERVHERPPLPQADSPLQIVEIMATAQDNAAGDKRLSTDWIEIYNSGKQTMDLSGLFLSDDPQNPHRWAFPEGTQLRGRSHLLVWADKSKEPGLHASFKLSKKGETVFLCSQEALLSELSFPRQHRGESYGRLDGTLQFLIPTPAAPNRGRATD